MTIIKCPKCGSSCPEGAKFCNECGEEIINVQQSKKPFKKIYWVVIGCIVLLLSVLYYFINVYPSVELKKAYDDKDYKKIVEINKKYKDYYFGTELEGYIQTAKMEIELDEKMEKAKTLISANNYVDAYDLLDKFTDKYTKVAEVKELKSKISPDVASEYLAKAKEFYKNKNYVDANKWLVTSLEINELKEAVALKPIYLEKYENKLKQDKINAEKQKKIEEEKQRLAELAEKQKYESKKIMDKAGKIIWKVYVSDGNFNFYGEYNGSGNYIVKLLNDNQDLVELITNEIGDYITDKTVMDLPEGWYYLEMNYSDGNVQYKFW